MPYLVIVIKSVIIFQRKTASKDARRLGIHKSKSFYLQSPNRIAIAAQASASAKA